MSRRRGASGLHRSRAAARRKGMYIDIGHGATKGSGYVGYELSGAPGVLGNDVWVKLSGFTGGAVGLAASQSASIPVRATSQSSKPLVYAYARCTIYGTARIVRGT